MRTIDCDTHYWPIAFPDRVDHTDEGRMEEEGFDVHVLISDKRPFFYELADDLGNAAAPFGLKAVVPA